MTSYGPDSDAVRQRRSRAHRRGDHSMCSPDRCPDATGPATRRFEVPDGGGVLAAVLDYIDTLPVKSDAGPQMILARSAVALASAIDSHQAGLAANIRELQNVMSHLGEADDETQLDDLRAKRAERRARLLRDYTAEEQA
ncbi:hypothetical protein [Nonomuraea glycinis]|uniref:hypothetical protein n=1 Tax=Nonomuraea glycinis TaxID=2047744 RepID=UPI002E133CA0|nr:hypothetical protein OHA68_41620 [Nonomuraea glycinis]